MPDYFSLEGGGRVLLEEEAGFADAGGPSALLLEGIFLVQRLANVGDTGSTGIFMPSAFSAGSCVIVHVFWNNTDPLTVTDNWSSTFSPIGTKPLGTGLLAGWSYQEFFCPAPVIPTAGTSVVTATASAAVHVALNVFEYSGFINTPTINDYAYRVGTSADGATRPSGSVDTTVDNCVITLGVFPYPGITSVASPFNDLAPGGDAGWNYCGVADYIVSSPQTALAATYTINSNSDDITGLVAIGDGSGGINYPKTGRAIAGD